jgi:hypothetical protein
MSVDTPEIPANHRPVRLLKPDGRTRGERRRRELHQAFAGELGDSISPAALEVVKRLAGVSLDLEVMDSARGAGEAIDPVRYCTSINAQRRLLRDLEALKARAATSSGLAA